MRLFLVVLLAGACAASAVPENFEHKQSDIWSLFKYINQPSYFKEHVEIATKYHWWEHTSSYSKPEVVEEFYKYYKYGKLLEKGEIFSVFYEEHLKQAISLFKLFYYADNWETLYKTAVWARNHVNEGVFLYSFSVALIHRPDTYYFVLPPIYEIYPHYFYSTEVIQEAQYYKQLYHGQPEKYNKHVIYANYSGHYLNLHPEQSLSYYLEDVGINSFYYYYNLYYPFWLSGEEFKLKHDNRGELFYYIYQQILARYYLERLSNDFGEIPVFNWEVPFETGYYPSLSYPNGLQFPTRPNYVHLYEYFYNYGQKYGFNKYAFSYSSVKTYEQRIHDVVDSGYVFTKSGEKVDLFSHEGTNILGNLIESNPDSPYYKYYGAYQVFARHLLGYSYQPLDYHKAYPSALEHFETSLRDPAFYQLYKKLLFNFIKYKGKHLHYHTEHDLAYPGVHVKNVEFERLITYFDYFYADLSNAIYVTPEEFVKDSFKIYVAQQRLTHKPFTYKIYVDSQTETDVVVKVFLGPKYDEYGRYLNLTENWYNFVQFDHFVYKLKAGENIITKKSEEIYNYIHDRTSYFELYQNAFGVYEKGHKFHFHGSQIWFGYPQRYILPKGSHGGVPYQFYVIVSKTLPYKEHTDVPIVGSGSQYVDGYPLGYPFDRPLYWEHIFDEIPNSYFYETKIYHREFDDVQHHHGPEFDYTDYSKGHHVIPEGHPSESHGHHAEYSGYQH